MRVGSVFWFPRSLVLAATSAFAQKNAGLTDKEIKIGQDTPLHWTAFRWSIQGRVDAAYISRLNAQGGINAVPHLIRSDDLTPSKAVRNAARELVESEQVLGLFCSVALYPTSLENLNQRQGSASVDFSGRRDLRRTNTIVVDGVLHAAAHRGKAPRTIHSGDQARRQDRRPVSDDPSAKAI